MKLADMKVVRVIETRAVTTGVRESASELSNLAKAHDSVKGAAAASASATTAAATAQSGAARVTETSARGQGTLTDAYEKTRRSLDPLAAARERYDRQMRTLDRGLSAGADPVEHSRLVNLAERRLEAAREKFERDQAPPFAAKPSPWGEASRVPMVPGGTVPLIQRASMQPREEIERTTVANDNLTKSVGLQRHEWVNLSRQMQDVGTMAAMGASPMQIITSQAAQVYDALASSQGGVKGAVKEIGSNLLGLLTPARLAFGGIIAGAAGAATAAYSYLAAQEEIEKRLSGIGRASGMGVREVNRIAETAPRAPGQSVGDAREALTTFASTGRIGGEIGASLIPMGDRLSRLLGVELTEANGMLAKAFADPIRGADGLNEKLGNLNDSTRRQIELQMAAGDRFGAQKTLLDSVAASTAGASKEVGFFADAWARAKGIMDGVGSTVAGVVAPSIEKQISDTEKQIQSLLQSRDPNRAGNRGGFGIPLDIPMGEDPALPKLQEELKRLQEERVERDRAEAFTAAGAVEAQRSRDAGDRIRPYLEERDSIEKLKAELEALDRLRNSPPGDIPADRIAEAYRKAQEQVGSTITAEERRQRIDELAIRSITARTDAERAAIAVEQKRLDLAGQRVDIDRRQAEIDARRAVMARGAREAEDRLRSANESASLAGLSPYERGRAEIEQRFRQNNEANAGNDVALRANRLTRDAELRGLKAEQIQGPLRDTTRSINEQVEALRVQRDSMYATDEAAAQMAAKQELTNAALRASVPLAEAYGGQLDALAKKMGEVRSANEEFQRVKANIVGGMDDIRGASRGLFSGAISDLRQGRNVGEGIKNKLFDLSDRMVERTLIKPAAESLLGQDGKPGGGLLGDLISKTGIFGSTDSIGKGLTGLTGGSMTGTMNVMATTVNITGGLSMGSGVPGASPLLGSTAPNTDGTMGLGTTLPSAFKNGAPVANPPDPNGFPSWLPRPSLYSAARGGENTNAYGADGSFSSLGWGPLKSGLAAKAAEIRDAGGETADALKKTASGVGSEGDVLVSAFSSLTSSIGSGLKGAFSLAGASGIGGSDLGIGSSVGFATGGFTGWASPSTAVGVVHGREYVFSAAATQRIGIGTLEAMHRGYDTGGYVDPAPSIRQPIITPPILMPPAASASAAPTSEPLNVVINEAPGVQSSVRREGNTLTIDQMERGVEGRMAKRMANGRGDLGQAVYDRSRGGAAHRYG